MLKMAFILSLLISHAFSNEIKLPDYDWKLSDIRSKGLDRNILFSEMDRTFIKTKSSICSNRALMWANDFKQIHNINTGKIFLFYTKKSKSPLRKTWWYHVAPVVNDDGTIWVLDAGFPYMVDGPQSIQEWFESFANSSECKEIKATEKDLIEFIYKQKVFPTQTSYGKFNCYFKIVPHPFWTPEIVAENLLGKNSQGRPVITIRNEIIENELYQACLEATTDKFGFALGRNKKECREYSQRGSFLDPL
jgi:hypothetical protein